MKRIGFIFIAVFVAIAMVSCGNEFSLRGHHFGDSVDQVKKLEGDSWELKEDEGIKYLYYGSVYGGFSSHFSYEFKDDRLFRIFIAPSISEDISGIDLFTKFKNELSTYGTPDEESETSGGYKALWKKKEYGIVLLLLIAAQQYVLGQRLISLKNSIILCVSLIWIDYEKV